MTATSPLVFRNARVFDGTAFLEGPHDVVVDDGIITSVSPTGSELPDGAIVDCAGRTLVPGFIDCHVHLMVTVADPVSRLFKPFASAFYESVVNARATVLSGVTSVRDAGGADLALKQAIETGIVIGPRLKISTSAISQTGGHADGHLPSGVDLEHFPSHEGVPYAIVDGADEARKVVRTLFRAGADQIKICTTGGVLSPSDDPQHPQFTDEEIAVFVNEAAAVDSYVMAHAIGAPGIKNAVRAGVRSIEHGTFADDEAIAMMAERGVFLVPTLTAARGVIKNAEDGRPIAPETVAKARRVADMTLEMVGKAHRAGVRIAMGSDAGIGVHGHGLDELSLMAESGMSLEETLSASTKVAAELIGESQTVGEIRAGRYADLVLLDFPLVDAEQLAHLPTSIEGVWKGGVRLRP